jgi:uncharacterized protein YjbJ (UPF0337 family)
MGLDDEVEAKIDQVKGKVKEELGEHGDDASMQAEGHADQAKGKMKEAWEDTKNAVGKGKEAIENR